MHDSQALDEEALLGNDFELLARTCGSSLRYVNLEGFAFRYCQTQPSKPAVESVAEWQPDEDDGDTTDRVEPLSKVGAESLSYPLRLPQWGPASLIHTLVGNLFDRSRRRCGSHVNAVSLSLFCHPWT